MQLLRSTLEQRLRPLYQQAIREVRDKCNPAGQLYGFAPLVGASYGSSCTRLLVVGRAVDGWRNGWDLACSDEEIINRIFWVPSVDEKIGCPMNWLPRNMAKAKDQKGRYNFRRSSFWSGARDVLKALEQKELSEHDWPGLMAWSNIYKISPRRGNPGRSLRASQISVCETILRAEMDILKPKHILFVTGGWGKRILESICINEPMPPGLIRFSGKIDFGGYYTNAVVAERPEGKKRRLWVEKVVESFRGQK